jgi:hypothetical protein
MSSAATVLVCVLSLLGRTQASFPPIQLVEVPPPEAYPRVEAYIAGGTIHLVTSSAVFQEAAETPTRCRIPAMKKLASILIHEERHVKYGEDEDDAYHAQLTTLALLGVPPDSAVYVSVQRSMMAVLKARKNKPVSGALEATDARNTQRRSSPGTVIASGNPEK